MRIIPPLVIAVIALQGCDGTPGSEVGATRAALDRDDDVVQLVALSSELYEPPEAIVQATWGDGVGAFGRENSGSDLGPMALTAELDGGVAVLDTVGARVYRFTPEGATREMVSTGVETADDLVVLDDGSLALMVYQRLPAPHYEILQRDGEGRWLQSRPAPQEATMPTGLFADGSTLLVEHRHGQLLSVDGASPRWGRPAGALQLRALREPGGVVVIEARDRQGERQWVRRLQCPWPVTEIRALESSSSYIALIVNHVIDASTLTEGESGHETWLVAFAHDGRPLGRARLEDRRVTDAMRPFALSPEGDLYEMQTDDDGLRVLRHRFGGAR